MVCVWFVPGTAGVKAWLEETNGENSRRCKRNNRGQKMQGPSGHREKFSFFF